ncbi:MAG: glycosyltransferase family 39 protein [Acidobacteriota bacterium]
MKARLTGNSRAGLFLFLASYACVLAALLPVLSLWLDEIYDLIVARMNSLTDVVAYVPHVSGNVPLNYVIQFGSVHLLGFSAFTGRLPSAIASVAACAGVFVLARKLGLRWPLLATGIFALFPLQLRYALEARPYELALCLSIWATVVFLRVVERPKSVLRGALYGLCIAAGLFTFPYSLFVPLAHLAWAGLVSYRARRWQPWMAAVLAVGIAGLLFTPWYWHSAASWRTAVAIGQLKGTITLHAVPMILRELVAAGYIGSLLVLGGFAYGLRKRSDWPLWLLYLMVPIVCAVAADAWFGYFLAIRQTIFVLTPLALLFTAGVEALPRRPATILTAALLITLTVGNVSFFRRPREDWRSAAAILANEPCVIYSPPDSRLLYAFFVPDLANRQCAPGQQPRVALAVSPYEATDSAAKRQRQLTESGYTERADFNPATPRIEIYVRR